MQRGSFWEHLEMDVEAAAASKGPVKGGVMATSYHLFIGPVCSLCSRLWRPLFHGWNGLRSAVQNSLFTFGVAARRYELGNRREEPVLSIRHEFLVREQTR